MVMKMPDWFFPRDLKWEGVGGGEDPASLCCCSLPSRKGTTILSDGKVKRTGNTHTNISAAQILFTVRGKANTSMLASANRCADQIMYTAFLQIIIFFHNFLPPN